MKNNVLGKNLKNSKFIICLCTCILILASVSCYLIINKNNNTENNILVDKENNLTKVLKIKGVNNKISFDIIRNQDFSYEVLDSNNNPIETSITNYDEYITINSSYKYNSTYTITIKNGTFVNKDYKEYNTIEFTIMAEPRKEVDTTSDEPSENENKKDEPQEETKNDLNIDVPVVKTYRYSKEEVKEMLKTNFVDPGEDFIGTQIIFLDYHESIDVDNNIITATGSYHDPGDITYICQYNYLEDTEECQNKDAAHSFITGICSESYLDNDYSSIDECVNDPITLEENFDYRQTFKDLLKKTGLTAEDLEVLK